MPELPNYEPLGTTLFFTNQPHYLARHWLRDVLVNTDVDIITQDNAVLILSELAGNIARHDNDNTGVFAVSVGKSRDPKKEGLILVIGNRGSTTPPLSSSLPDKYTEGQRGLYLVDALSKERRNARNITVFDRKNESPMNGPKITMPKATWVRI